MPVTAELFQLMAQRVQDYAIFLLDAGGHVISWNDGARRLKQYAEDEIIGKHFSVFYTAEDKQRDWPASELQRARVDGRFEDDGWRVRKDGSRFWANVIITALRDDGGQLVAFSKITRDLTERKLQEDHLRQSEERFRLLVDGVQDYAIYMLSPDGVVTSWNLGARRIKGYQSAEIVGKHFSRFYGPEDIAAGKPWAELAMAREHGRAEDEGWRVRKDGTRFWARVVVTPLHDSDGKLSGFAKVTQDLTQRRHSQALESAAKQTSDFIAVLSHELRNPLAPIRNAVTLLKDTGPGDPDYETLRQAVDRQSALLSRIVDDLLDISRIVRGTFAVQKETIDLAVILSRALEGARPGIDAAKHGLTVDLPAHPAFVQGDELRLTQALTNILNNAARYTDPGGRIVVTLRKEEGASPSLALSIRDTGRGIDPQLLGTIFGMFVQGRDAASKPQSGLGVGLALARTIVELHHGTIEAKSEGAGKGSEFIIRLPMAESASIAAAPVPAASPEKQSMRRVLVVDDNVDAAVVLSALIRNLGHDVLTVHDGAEALQISEGFRPDVVMLDIGMPGMDGYEVARRMRGRNRSPRPLIVAITGWGKPEDELRSREAGFDVHLVKPVEPAQLRQVLAAA